MNIREFQESDWKEVVTIYNLAKTDEFIGTHADIEIVPLEKDHQMLELFETSNICIYEDTCIKGFAGSKGTYISWLFVHPQHRRMGIASKLMMHILALVKGTIALNVAATNTASINLYTKLGFLVTREFESDYQGVPVKILRMECNNN